MDAPQRQIPAERQVVYYAGMALIAIGLLLFLSTFVTFLANFGNFDGHEARMQSGALRAFGGIVLTWIGGFMRNLGAKGLAGSGILLDPEQGRRDVEPWSRMGGGMVQDALSEVDLVQRIGDRRDPPEPEVKVRCQACRALNDETDKFCGQCGAAI